MYQFHREEYNKRMEWYQDARFGMFKTTIQSKYYLPHLIEEADVQRES